jgi:hypothetical protein
MPETNSTTRTGIFQLEKQAGIVVLWRGQEICRYDSIELFVDTHLALVDLLEKKLEKLLEEEYRDKI